MGRRRQLPSISTSSRSMPVQRPSTSAAWIRNSAQCSASMSSVSAVTRSSVKVCHRFMATAQPPGTLRQLKSSTRRSAPTAETRSLSFPSRNFPSASNRQEVTITWLAPAEIHSFAFPGVMPPPTWRPPGHAARASRAARSLPGPSLITWPPCRPSLRYKSAYHAAPRSETKLVRREAPSCVREPPTICFTRPSCKSMHGLNLVTRPLCPPYPRRSRRDYPPAPSGKRARKITQNSPGPPLYRITAPEHHSRSR